MKRNSLLLIALIGLIALSGCENKPPKNLGSSGQCILCFGDSLTFGYGVNKEESYPSALAKMVDIPVINAGTDGDTTGEALTRLNSGIPGKEPCLVIIEFGGNDFLKRVPLENTVNNIKNMVDIFQAKGAMVAIVDISSGILMKDYNAVYEKLARQTDCIYIRGVFNGIITNPRLKSDFFHPNATGYKLVADRIFRAISPYLNKDTRAKSSELN